LLETTRALKRGNFPRSQLYRLRRIMETTPGVIASTMEYLYTRVRQNEQVRTMLMKHIENAWRSTDPLQRSTAPPWLPTKQKCL
jgi:CRISPR-associated protein Cmr2